MNDKSYSHLKKELPAIGKIVSNFPESLQGRVFDVLVGQLLGDAPDHPITTPKGTQPKVHGKEIKGIAHVDQQGKFHLSVRDPKAKNTNDAARRLTYVAIRAHQQLTGDANVSSKDVIAPILRTWRCYTGNTRNALANDKGIHRSEGLLGLDTPAKDEADRFMKEILDDKIEGKWKPSASKNKKNATKPGK